MRDQCTKDPKGRQIEVRPGIVTPGINATQGTLDQLDLPADSSQPITEVVA